MANIPPAPSDLIPLVDVPTAPDVFADRLAGAFLTNGNVHITFVSRRCNHSKTPGVFADVVIGRLVMPFSAVEETLKFLGGWVEKMKDQSAPTADEAPRILQ